MVSKIKHFLDRSHEETKCVGNGTVGFKWPAKVQVSDHLGRLSNDFVLDDGVFMVCVRSVFLIIYMVFSNPYLV